jgi:hypothetical protein
LGLPDLLQRYAHAEEQSVEEHTVSQSVNHTDPEAEDEDEDEDATRCWRSGSCRASYGENAKQVW